MSELRVRLEDPSLKYKLEELASLMGISVNQLVGMVLSAQFNKKDSLAYSLLLDLANFKKEKEKAKK